MKKIFPYFLFLILFSCTNSEEKTLPEEENVDGGPCSYHEDYFPLEILEIDSSDVENCELTLLKIIEEDTIYYSHYNPNLLPLSEIKSKKIKTSDTITFVEMNIEKGSCNPFIQTVSIELYNSKLAQ